MLVLSLLLTFLEALPHAENPWPESIGLGFPFTLAGAMGILAQVATRGAPLAQRDRAAASATAWGFCAGWAIYALLLCLQALTGGS